MAPESSVLFWSRKRRLWDHNGFLRLVEAPPLSSGVLPSRQQYLIEDYPGTPPPSVYQVTHGTALQAAERYLRHLSCGESRHITSIRKHSGAWRALLNSNRGQRPRY